MKTHRFADWPFGSFLLATLLAILLSPVLLAAAPFLSCVASREP